MHDYLVAFGGMIFLANVSVRKAEVLAGFSCFSPGVPTGVPIELRNPEKGNDLVAVVTLPETLIEQVQREQMVAMGDFDGPLIFERIH